uniref:Uncharacterized protein n=1 Tax=Panthera tigris altaica TaxID=74533 RepID=A0A8C9K9E9_PANTA
LKEGLKKKNVYFEVERLLKMTLEERRKEYMRDYVPLNTILSWKEEMKGKSQNDGNLVWNSSGQIYGKQQPN